MVENVNQVNIYEAFETLYGWHIRIAVEMHLARSEFVLMFSRQYHHDTSSPRVRYRRSI